MAWKVIETKDTAKKLLNLPKKIRLIYWQLVFDMEREGPFPYGWDALALKGHEGIRIKLTREYRVIVVTSRPSIIVVKIAHRKEVYK